MKSNNDPQAFFQELLRFDSKEKRIEREKHRLHFKFMSGIERVMEERGLSKKDLAKQVGTSASYITQLFRASKNVNLEILAKIKEELDLEYEIHVVCEDMGEKFVPPFMVYQQKESKLRVIKKYDWSYPEERGTLIA